MRKCTKILICLTSILILCLMLPQNVQASRKVSEMTIEEDGAIHWEAYSSDGSSIGWKFHVINWRFTIKKDNLPAVIIDVYPAEDLKPEGGYAHNTILTEIDAKGVKHYTHQYSLPIEVLEKISGLDLKTGDITYEANAGIGFHYKTGTDSAGKSKYCCDWKCKHGSIFYTEEDVKKHWQSYYSKSCKNQMCSKDGHEVIPGSWRFKGFYGQDVEFNAYCVTIKSDIGYNPDAFYGTYSYEQPNGEWVTKEFTGKEVWVPKGGSVTVNGTTNYGYKTNGSISRSNIAENKTVYLTSTPWKHTVTFDLNGGNGKPDDFTKIYTEVKYLPIQTPTKAGYTFTGWKSAVTGITYQPEELYEHSQDGGVDTLVAQWKENEYTFVFDGNGGEGTMPPITKKYTDSFKLPECLFVNGESVFMGWDADSGAMEATYKVGDKAKVKDIVSSLGYDFVNGATINIYALWNLAPRISAVDRYFSLWEAQNGHITEEELFGTASAYDMEDGEIVKGEQFYLESYYADLYTGFTDSASCTETYVAIDSAGNKIKKTITVHVANTETQESIQSSKYNYVRAISLKYLDYPASDGGLMNNSIWREKANYEYLKSVLQIKRINPEIRSVSLLGMTVTKEVPGTGEWNAPIEQHWKFTKEDADKVKEFIRIHGFGNSKEPGALKLFLQEFAYCRLK